MGTGRGPDVQPRKRRLKSDEQKEATKNAKKQVASAKEKEARLNFFVDRSTQAQPVVCEDSQPEPQTIARDVNTNPASPPGAPRLYTQ
jgi:hypothetical protein